ncbi:hypothetical protein ISR94_00075 [Candidatus Microgenomates bacterium]|nr:hypothetical protein [Candidatus Microgenomates bacterium]
MGKQDRKIGDHNTCTSSPLAEELGYDPENLPVVVLNDLHKRQTGTDISRDLVTARLQREIALVKDKRGR